MTKSFLSLLLICTIHYCGFTQQLDSVQINNEWRYVYPVNERIDFDDEYYDKFQLTAEEYPIWVQWKMVNDARADLKWKDLKQALQTERYKRKEVTDSVYNKKNDNSFSKGGFQRVYSKKEYRENFNLLYSLDCRKLDFIPPVVRDLPNGKFVQFFEPYATYNKRSECTIVTREIAAEFELLDNELQNKFERFEPDSTLVASGNFDKSLKTGLWFETAEETDHFWVKGELLSYTETAQTNYELGVKNGEIRKYSGRFLKEIENYENGEITGQKTEIDYQDSVVYDLYSMIDDLVNYPSLEKIHGRGIRNYPPDFKEKVKLPKTYDMERIQPYLFTSFSMRQLDVKIYPDSVLTDNQSKYGSYRLGSRTVPLFETYYKVYDRKTKKLIFVCSLDTVTKLFSGASWYENGQKFDTIWTNPETMKLERIVYDLNGSILYNTLDENKTNDTKIIDGFVATPYYSEKKGLRYYFLDEKVLRGDTLFQIRRWDVNGKLIANQYLVSKDSVFYSIAEYENGFCLFESNPERKLINYSEKGIEFSILIPLKIGEPTVNIRVNGQAYEGPILFECSKNDGIEWKNGTLKLLYMKRSNAHEIELGNVFRERYESRSSFVKLLQAILLNFQESGLYLESVSGLLKDNHFEGKTILEDSRSNKMELNYVNGQPNGKILIYNKYRDKHFSDLTRHNVADKSCHFSDQRFNRSNLTKSYTFKDGVLDGPMVFYTYKGDTSGVIPFENGLKNGKVFQYKKYTLMNAEFKNDTLVNKINVSTIFHGVYDTLLFVALDNNGDMISALYKSRIYKRELMSYVLKRIRYTKLPNGIIEAEISDDNDIYKREEIDGDEFIRFDLVQANVVKYTEEFTGEEKPICNDDVISIINCSDNEENGIIWNKESVKYHNYHSEQDDYIYQTERDRFPKTIKKYFSNGFVLREGAYRVIFDYSEAKSGIWKVNDYNGRKLYELDYRDSMMKIAGQDWSTIGVMTEFDSLGNNISTKAVLSEKETYECSSDDYYAERQYITLSSKNPAKMNGWMKNYYDNGALMNEGKVVNGVPEGLWKFYTPDGKLTRLGNYLGGKENGKWLFGDLGEKAYIGEVCIDPNDPEYEFVLHQLEMDKEIEVVVYKNGVEINSSSFSSARHSRRQLEYGDSF